VFHATGDYSCSHGFNSTKDKYCANRQFFRNYADTVKRTASWHFTVDDSGISQLLSLNERGYHASNKEINDSSIGIEMCVNHYKDFQIFRKTLENEKLLIKEILKLYPKLQLIRHHDADEKNHKNCPEIFTDEQWKIIYDFIINDKEISDDFLKNYTKLKIEYKNGKDTKMF
jgi:N-acetylmuramoyl-L-alanine amidase CwlA